MTWEPFVVLLPLFGAMLAMPVGRALGPRAAELLTTAFVLIAAILSWVLFFNVTPVFGGEAHARTIELFTWIGSGDFVATWSVRLDSLSAVMLIVVNSVSFLVHTYSMGYMKDYGEQSRFFAYLSLFTFAMLTLVTADNFLQLFFGWEGVGLASYLLIGFWFNKKSANDAAIKAFVVNRVGDFGFALGIMAIFYVFGTIQFDEVFQAVAANAVATPWRAAEGAPIQELTIHFLSWDFHALTVIGVLLFIGAMGKSAQFLLHTWLPDAMEGPTPVSALIHAATMVTAGVFLVCRCSVIYEYAPNAAAMVTLVGAVTAFFAATVGLLQDDIKKIVAYSTCSQLGYMFFAAGVGAYGAAMFHLFTHAFFKALLFLGSGAVIIGMHHEQDIKKMGGVKELMPFTHILMVIGTIAITGVGIPGLTLFGAPFGTAGFVSKDMILESAFFGGEAGKVFGYFAFTLGILAAVMTAFYSWRLIFLTFWGPSRAPEHIRKHPHAVPDTMMWPLVPLAIGALFAGIVFYGSFVGSNADRFWNGALYSAEASHEETASTADHLNAEEVTAMRDEHDVEEAHGEAADHAPADERAAEEEHGGGHHEIPGWVLWSPFLAMLIGTFSAGWHYLRGDPLKPGMLRPGGMIYAFLKNKWYFDEIYDFIFVKPAYAIGRFLWKDGDGKTIDGVGPDGIAAVVAAGARRIVKMQSGYVYHYAFVMLVGIALLVTFILVRAGSGQ
ncbi:NADH-quinone oxidoreductase subunit L [Hyphococcus luteus]|uniref:NADH-quinone oxidoreductase subunit L n=1 Tax=Hyphococcus luteus TaxID=2058213 RepID=A0A2S7KAB9_9PROT|nr:NADH-quinone oxidoreductase subunit L [Marinicaulis flavus]PQA89464.1 NADH-quinone oxidoreductase subunit L [Marinicaulis flavus]